MEIPPSQSLHRRTIATTASVVTAEIPFDIASSPSSFDFQLISLKPSSFVAYTSLKDILTSPGSSSINLPAINGSSSFSAGDISIRNRLVKQAAWSYLQPTTLTSSGVSPESRFLRRIWLNVSAGIQFLRRMVDWIFQSIRIPLTVK